MASYEELRSRLVEARLPGMVIDVLDKLKAFVDDLVGLTGGEVIGYAAEIFPGVFVLNVFLDAAVVVGEDITLVLESDADNAWIRVDDAELRIPQIDCVEVHEESTTNQVKVCAVNSRDADNVDGRALRYAEYPVRAGSALLFIVRPTWNIIHVGISETDKLREFIDEMGIRISL